MTRRSSERDQMIEMVICWAGAARERGDVELGKGLWRVQDALAWGGALEESIELLAGLKQTEAVVKIRAALERDGERMKKEIERLKAILARVAALVEGHDFDTYTNEGRDAMREARSEGAAVVANAVQGEVEA